MLYNTAPEELGQLLTEDNADGEALIELGLVHAYQGDTQSAEAHLARAHLRSYGRELESYVTPGYLDGRVFMLYDDCPCLVYGPYSDNIHGFDERVSLTSVKQVTGTIALFIADWCGLEPVSAP